MGQEESNSLIGYTIILCLLVVGSVWTAHSGRALPAASTDRFGTDPIEAFHAWNQQVPEDRVYLHGDRPLYRPGETIWFSAYVRDGKTFKPSPNSDIVHVEIINPKGTVESTLQLVARNGQAQGDYTLNPQAPGGLYKLKAYTNWQKNDDDPAFFIKEIQVQDVVVPRLKMTLDFVKKAYGPGDRVEADLDVHTNENKPLTSRYKAVVKLDGNALTAFDGVLGKDGKSRIGFVLPKNLSSADGLLNVSLDYEGQLESIGRSIPIVLNKIRLTFHPEGGDLVMGLPSRVAFRAIYEFGKPADVEGSVEDETGAAITAFKSFHHGMGAFPFTPRPGRTYTVRIVRPEGVLETFALPTAREEGVVMNVVKRSKDSIQVRITSTVQGAGRLFAHVRGREVFDERVPLRRNGTNVTLPVQEAPIGVMAITLFDADRVARAERLVFVNKDKKLKVDVQPDKPWYLPREKVKINLSVRDEKGQRSPGVFSLAVVDDQWLTFADDKSSTLLSHMLLEADVPGKIEEPRFYFDPRQTNSDEALDYLLMTRGWRRFTWERLSGAGAPPAVRYPGEKAELAGVVLGERGNPVPGARVEVIGANSVAFTNNRGEFSIRGVDLSEPRRLDVHKEHLHASTTIDRYTSSLRIFLYQQVEGSFFNPLPPQAQAEGDDARGAFLPRIANMKQAMVVEQREILPAEDRNRVGAKLQEAVHDPWAENARVDMPARRAIPQRGRNADRILFNGAFFMDDVNEVPAVAYYRAREFPSPDYANDQTPDERADFRSTLFWKGDVTVGETGSAFVEFFNGDAVSSFRASAEGFSNEGGVGAGEALYYTQLPFSLSVKVPPVFVTGDRPILALTVKNTTDRELTGTVTVKIPFGMRSAGDLPPTLTVPARDARVLPIPLIVETPSETSEFKASFETLGRTDAFTQPVKIVPQGFPVDVSYSGQEKDTTFRGSITNVIPRSIRVRFIAYPTVISDLLSGVGGMLREPYGCFEQTSASSYPNALILSYLTTRDNADPALVARAEDLLAKGYQRLTTFSTKDNGYEWFGSDPGHEALTAYGLMQFEDMAKLSPVVDRGMIQRTAAWLLSRRDGKGGFQRNPRALDSYGGADPDVTDAYIVYALSEAGLRNLDKELDAVTRHSMRTRDPYLLALTANALFRQNETTQGLAALQSLLAVQSPDGSWTGTRHSITRSEGKSLQVETTALACLAILSSPSPRVESLRGGIQFLLSSRSGYGDFGSTQSTVLALKALVRHAQWSKRTPSSGTIIVSVNGIDVATRPYRAGEKGAITIDGLEKHLSEGPFSMRVRFSGTKSALPYSLGVSYTTRLPSSSKECPVALETTLESTTVKTGDTARLTSVLTNTTGQGLPMTMAILGLPAGFSAQPWQLKELLDKRVVDFYEISGNEVVFYYRQLKPNEKRQIPLDLKAELAGTFTPPASRAYLYYTNEHKSWTATDPVTIIAP